MTRGVQYTRTVTVRIIHVAIRTDRKDLKMAYSPQRAVYGPKTASR